MAKWIDDLGDYLAKENPDKFRLTKDRRWQFKTQKGWTTAPHHHVLGIELILIGAVGWSGSKSTLGKVVSGIVGLIGIYLVLDDIEDLLENIQKFFEK